MKWEEMTSKELREFAKRKDAVAVMGIGCVEKHGDHLPLGTDSLTVYKVVEAATERESAVLLPPLWHGILTGSKQFPGSINIKRDVLFAYLENVCDEVSANGLKKILIVNGHGGNSGLLATFVKSTLHREVDYALYVMNGWSPPEGWDGHGGAMETSLIMVNYPNLVKMREVKGPMKSNPSPIPDVITPVDWIAICPNGYTDDPTAASVELGKRVFGAWVEGVMKAIQRIKEDAIVPEIMGRMRRVPYEPYSPGTTTR